MTQGYVVLAEFAPEPTSAKTFLQLVAQNAAASVRNEPGCRRFDVLVSDNADDAIVLYEIYADEAAFDAHLQTAHFAAFDSAVAGMIRSRSVRRFALYENVKGA
jgi:quinol monooxygenase YgiN